MLPDDYPMLTWMAQHVACLRNRYHVGNDGLTPWGHVTGRRSESSAVEFGERVMFMARGPHKERLWLFGIWLGPATRQVQGYAVEIGIFGRRLAHGARANPALVGAG